ncbi:MAG: class I SAM-dependent methyltransferase [Actinobacteria bacterium]|nr:class I SAM-dependent methyltransferase [Actinomycetota bacterium]
MTAPGTPHPAGQDKWEQWWAGLDGTPGEVVWDADPADLEADLGCFAGSLDPALPVVDFGCGDGRQTRYLAGRFPHVVGTDISAAAIRRARAASNPPNVTFQVLDARDMDGAARLHDELGDANVYIRGVLQALPPACRPGAVQIIAALLGAAGTLFAKELPPEASSYFADMTQQYGMPPTLAKLMRTIPPGQISLPELSELFPANRFEVLDTGTSRIRTVNSLPGGVVISVPAIWILTRPRRES